MFDETEIKNELKNEFNLLGVVTVAVKLNNLCKLLIEKGVVTEEEINKLNMDSVEEITNAVLEE